jgi:hypothetical protein
MRERLAAGFRQERDDDNAQQENEPNNRWYHRSVPIRACRVRAILRLYIVIKNYLTFTIRE